MSDRRCEFCGNQVDCNGPWMVQGRQMWLCYECWDECVGIGDEEPTEEDLDYEFDD